MRLLISDIKNDFEPLNFIQVSQPSLGIMKQETFLLSPLFRLFLVHSIKLIETLEWTEPRFNYCTNCLHSTPEPK